MTFMFGAAITIELITLTVGIGFLVWALRNKKNKIMLAQIIGFLVLIFSVFAFTLHHLL